MIFQRSNNRANGPKLKRHSKYRNSQGSDLLAKIYDKC